MINHVCVLSVLYQLKKLEESLGESKQRLEESQEQLKTNENGQ